MRPAGGDFAPAVHVVKQRIAWDIALGRWMAFCAHPVCAWRVRSTPVRALVVAAYFAASYIGMLVALLSF